MEMVLAAGFILLIVLIFMSGDPRDEWSRSRGTAKGHEEANPNIVTLTSANWEKEVLQSSTPVLVDFWAPWCGPCRMLSPAIDRVATRYAGKVKVAKLNIDNARAIAREYDIDSIPRVLLFRKGVPQRVPVNPGDLPATEANIAALIDRLAQ